MTHNRAVRTLQAFNHILLTIGVFFVFNTKEYEYLWIALFTYWTIGILGVNVGLHRLLSHRSFVTNTVIEHFLSIVGVITTIGSPIAWVAVHRHHHRSADTVNDVHSPRQLGSFKAWFGFWNYSGIELKLIRDLRRDKFQRFCHKHYFGIILTYCMLLAIINPWLIIFAYAIPACLCLHSSSSIIVIAHKHGYQTHKVNDDSKNSWIANLFTMGEGWHNNHHAKPYAWSNWEKWWEWDIPSLIIRVIKK